MNAYGMRADTTPASGYDSSMSEKSILNIGLRILRTNGIFHDIYRRKWPMSQLAKVFMNGRSQAVRLPAEFRFDCAEVYVRRDPATGACVRVGSPGD